MTAQQAQLIRVTLFEPRPGREEQLLEAAHENAAEALAAPGCLSAEVGSSGAGPDRVAVISRWASPQAVEDFLAWHRSKAHASVKPFALASPQATHYLVN